MPSVRLFFTQDTAIFLKKNSPLLGYGASLKAQYFFKDNNSIMFSLAAETNKLSENQLPPDTYAYFEYYRLSEADRKPKSSLKGTNLYFITPAIRFAATEKWGLLIFEPFFLIGCAISFFPNRTDTFSADYQTGTVSFTKSERSTETITTSSPAPYAALGANFLIPIGSSGYLNFGLQASLTRISVKVEENAQETAFTVPSNFKNTYNTSATSSFLMLLPVIQFALGYTYRI